MALLLLVLPVPVLMPSRLADPHPLSLLFFSEASFSATLDTALPRFRPAREKRFLLDRPTEVVAGPSSLGGVIIVAILLGLMMVSDAFRNMA